MRQGIYQKTARCDQYASMCAFFALISNNSLEANAVDTLQNQFSGYGSTSQVIARCLDKIALKEPLEHWSDETIEKVVNTFTDEKFPTVIALNKIDHPDADKVGSSRRPVCTSMLMNAPECKQDCKVARSTINRIVLRHLRSLPAKISQAKVHQVYRGQRVH